MGRVKLNIKRLENINGRQATFAKRKHGIMKKANELSILCDIKILLLMFSPSGKPSLCKGKHGIEEVIAKFAQLTPQERAKRKLESLEALKKTFKKLDHDVNIPEFLGTSTQTIEELTNHAGSLQTQISEIHKRLSYWNNLEKINSVEDLGQMENLLKESLNQLRVHKDNIEKQQMMSLECSNQFQNVMHVPQAFTMGAEQQLQSLSWIQSNDNQHVVLQDDQNLLPQRDVECTASSSFGSHSGFFGQCQNSEISNLGQENGILNEMGANMSLSSQLGGQFPYLAYNLNMLNDMKYHQPQAEMNLQQSSVDYRVNGSFEAPRPEYDTTHSSWAPTSGPCAVTMFDEHLFPQQPEVDIREQCYR